MPPGESGIKERGWRQGCVLPPPAFDQVSEESGLEFTEQGTLPIVISQDCDVVHSSFEKEPYVEIIRAASVPALDGKYVHAKNPRVLHLPVTWDGVDLPYGVSIHEKARIDRHLLEEIEPDARAKLSNDNVGMLSDWVARRYVRASFPDEFQRRLGSRKPWARLKSLLAEEGTLVTGVFVRLHTQSELPASEAYRLIVRVTVEGSTFEDEDIRFQLRDDFLERLVDLLEEFDGIKVVEYQLVSEADFSLEDLKNTQRLDFDYLSYADDPGGEIATTL